MPRSKPQLPPMCNYGSSCNRKGCVYRHPAKNEKKTPIEKSSVICVHFVSGTCSFGSKCANRHPGKDEAQKFREQCAKIECKFGPKCENAACLYRHDGRGYQPQQICIQLSKKDTSQDMWWQKEFNEDQCDPISLEPLCELTYPPFELGGHYFDGVVLATYVVSTSSFVNPMTREQMTRVQCRALDEYLQENDLLLASKSPKVTEAFDLSQRTNQGGQVDNSLQREATTLLHSLFGFESYRDQSASEERYIQEEDNFLDEREVTTGQTLAAAWDSLYLDSNEHYYTIDSIEDSRHNEAKVGDNTPIFDASTHDDIFPSLRKNSTELSAQAPEWQQFKQNIPTFAEAAAKPAIPNTINTKFVKKKQRPPVKIPQDAWVQFRDARIFGIRDPLERYAAVAALQTRPDVLDLHFQSTRTAPLVLDQVLDEALKARGQLWLVTGSGHHVPRGTHQLCHGVLHSTVLNYLEDNGYDFAIAKDNAGHAGAFLIYGHLRTYEDEQMSMIKQQKEINYIRPESQESPSFYQQHNYNNSYNMMSNVEQATTLEPSSFLVPPSPPPLPFDDQGPYFSWRATEDTAATSRQLQNLRANAAVAPPPTSRKNSSVSSSSPPTVGTSPFYYGTTTLGLPSPPTGGRYF
mmetsp:Transcript_54/g.80  ORF Transcript_54/g.80 Transcript_54/m.80 type:complete len:634 (+) Transcript_54:111-2012(+)|eukprot:CAMPEP_0197320268 /NCGR_PEP_ID=MMETSP0891-20130614/58616_1 /TAXON_ID=44058 ORGANISM="Aureoumbra lagunensis, Strain CCMP1510" /NCGR_SAMPLE_ID=MMETSP0891 /ASSEMBLY_ACC=CAM_ASM_000534 /LENGTH=633 /DNA_ID=CAMNT_0042811563 /DNA_START=36 /DNA_END=1937 /DNA_ORIENTATION=+